MKNLLTNEEIIGALEEFIRFNHSSSGEALELALETLEFDVIEDVGELNELYGLNLTKIEDYEYSTDHFDTGSWLVYKGVFIRFDYEEEIN